MKAVASTSTTSKSNIENGEEGANQANEVLPLVPKNCSFSREEFVSPNFSVDKFVKVQIKNCSLEQLREDLSGYLRILRLSLIELINEDYSDFVNLSGNLVGLDKSIHNISDPLKNFRGDVNRIEGKFKLITDSFNIKVNELNKIKRKKMQLSKIINVMKGIDKVEELINNFDLTNEDEKLNLLERLLYLFNKIKVDFTFLDDNIPIVKNDLKPRLDKASEFLSNGLENCFLNAITNENDDLLRTILNIYSLNGNYSDLEVLFRKKIVAPYMKEVIAESYLDKNGIDNFFDELLKFVDSNLKILNEGKNHGFNFIVNSVWNEIANCMIIRTPSIFSPGNPDYFHFQYSLTYEFIQKFKIKCDLTNEQLERAQSYKELIKKFNLEVYFHIRQQQILSKFEQCLNDSSIYQFIDLESEFKLFLTQTLYECIMSCWCTKSFFIPNLFASFWKLTLELLSRFAFWLENVKLSDINLSNGPTNDKLSNIASFLIVLANECQTLIEKFQNYFDNFVIHLKPANTSKEDLIESLNKSFDQINNKGLANVIKIIKICFVSQCDSILKQVNDVPRLYRKTNREVPVKASNYVFNCIDLLNQFTEGEEKHWKKQCIKDVLEEVTFNYKEASKEVLTSVQKIEDSLKRLKRGKANQNIQQKNNQSMTDDDKIRLQIILDIEAYAKQVSKMHFCISIIR